MTRSFILAASTQVATNLISINKNYSEGRWAVALRGKMNNTKRGVILSAGKNYTSGLAPNGIANPAVGHWVPRPVTFNYGGDDKDFSVE